MNTSGCDSGLYSVNDGVLAGMWMAPPILPIECVIMRYIREQLLELSVKRDTRSCSNREAKFPSVVFRIEEFKSQDTDWKASDVVSRAMVRIALAVRFACSARAWHGLGERGVGAASLVRAILPKSTRALWSGPYESSVRDA